MSDLPRRRGGRPLQPPRHDPTPKARRRVDIGPEELAWRRTDAQCFELIEMVGLAAEQAVHPHLASADRRTAGRSVVYVRFHDAGVQASLRRIGAVTRTARASRWLLVRRWAEAEGDGGLDEAMCRAAALSLNASLPGLVSAQAVTFPF